MTDFAAHSFFKHHRYVMAALAFLFIFAGSTQADPNEGPLPLHKAFADGLITVNVTSVSGYSRVFLKIKNLECGRRSLRIPGSYLRPSSPRYQRLALGYSEADKSGDIVIEPKGTWEGWVTSCCMDGGLGTPGNKTRMRICGESAPDEVSRIMADWAANPAKTQSEVNGKVWAVDRPSRKPAPALPRFLAEGAELESFGDRIMLRFASGDLVRLRDDGKWQVMAIGAGRFAVGPRGVVSGFGLNSTRSYNETARAWSDLAPLHSAERFMQGQSETYALAGRTLYVFEGRGWKAVRRQVIDACVGFELSSPSVWAITTDRKILRWNAAAGDWKVSTGSGYIGIYPTSSALYAMDSKGIVAFGKDKETRILSCPRQSQVKSWRGGIFLRRPGENAVLEYSQGKGWDRHSIPGNADAIAVDAISGRLLALLSDGRIVSPGVSGSWTDLARLPGKDPRNVAEGMLFDPEGSDSELPETEKPHERGGG